MINAGEAGGVLDIILNRLADFMEKAAKLKKEGRRRHDLPRAWSSPSPSAIVSMIMVFVVPKFADHLQAISRLESSARYSGRCVGASRWSSPASTDGLYIVLFAPS